MNSISFRIANPPLIRFLSTIVRRYKIAKVDRSAQWPNRCIGCNLPLMTPRQKKCICKECWDDLPPRVDPNEVPDYPPQYDEYDYEREEDEYIPCCVCGANCSGYDYENYRLCSRRCMREGSSGRYY